MAKQYQTAFLIVYVDTEKEQCIEPNAKRKGLENVDESVINRMNDQFQPPNDEKYKWEFNHCFTLKSNPNLKNKEDDDNPDIEEMKG